MNRIGQVVPLCDQGQSNSSSAWLFALTHILGH
jgi:hypothetical protein